MRSLFKAMVEILGWDLTESFYDWSRGQILNTAAGKAMLAALGALLTAGIAEFTNHPQIRHDAIVVFMTAIAILLPSLIQRLYSRSKSSPNDSRQAFNKFPLGSVFGTLSVAFADLEHRWTQCDQAYRAFVSSWNRMSDFKGSMQRKELAESERKQLALARWHQEMPSFKRSSDLFLEQVAEFHGCLKAFVEGKEPMA